MEEFFLKARDTQPALQVTLKNPDGSVHDLTGNTALKLHIKLDTGTVLSRDMTAVGLLTAGTVRYQWVDADWIAGALVAGAHDMEYEVITATGRTTFPNNEYHKLKITADLGQG